MVPQLATRLDEDVVGLAVLDVFGRDAHHLADVVHGLSEFTREEVRETVVLGPIFAAARMNRG